MAVQALVGCLAGSGRADGALTVLVTAGSRVALSAEPALRVDASSGPEPGYAVTLAAAPLAASDGVTGARWATAPGRPRRQRPEIAEALHVSVATVHEHVAALHRALGTTTRPRLVAALAGTPRSGYGSRRGMLTW